MDGDDADDEEGDENEAEDEEAGEMDSDPEDGMFKSGSDYENNLDYKRWRAEFARKWKHFERQEIRRLKRGVGPAQLFRHPGIEEKMWTPNTSSSEEPESDGIDMDE